MQWQFKAPGLKTGLLGPRGACVPQIDVIESLKLKKGSGVEGHGHKISVPLAYLLGFSAGRDVRSFPTLQGSGNPPHNPGRRTLCEISLSMSYLSQQTSQSSGKKVHLDFSSDFEVSVLRKFFRRTMLPLVQDIKVRQACARRS